MHYYKELHLFWNNVVIRATLAIKFTDQFHTIKQSFPHRGHFYSSCERKFAIIKWLWRCGQYVRVKNTLNLFLNFQPVGVIASDFLCAVKRLRSEWQEEWSAAAENKLWQIKIMYCLGASFYRSNRLEQVVLCRLRIGHRVTHQ